MSALERISDRRILICRSVRSESRQHATRRPRSAFDALTLHYNLFVAGGLDTDALLARALTEKYERTLGRALQLLGLMTASGDVAAVRHTLKSADARARSGAIEYLDNLLKGEVRKRVMLLIEEMPLEERIRKGNVIYRTRVRDVEDTLAQLLHDEDESIASAAILLVEANRVWSLAGDLEHVLAHRDVRDFHVFEAASWALAANRMQSERRQRLVAGAPACGRARRPAATNAACSISRSSTSCSGWRELGRQVRYETGHVMYERGATPASFELVLDGQVLCDRPGGRQEMTAPAALALEEILEGAPMGATVTATNRVTSLSMTPGEFLAVLSENEALAAGLFRQFITARGLDTGHTIVRGSRTGLAGITAGELRVVDRMLVLQSSPLLAHATAAQLWSLSQIARPVTLAFGAEALKPDAEPAMLFVVAGNAAC